MTQGAAVRRMTVVGNVIGVPRSDPGALQLSASQSAPPEPVARPDQVTRDRLVVAFEALVAQVRSEEWAADSHDGVLLDIVVGGIHCVMLEYTPPLLVELSPREKQVALMVARGRTNQAIASALEISVWTVSTHLRRVFAKLAVSSRAEMVAHLLDDAEFTSQIGR